MIKSTFAKVAAITTVALGLSACNTTTGLNPTAVGTVAGALGGAAIARDSNSYDRALAIGAGALIGNVIGSALTPPVDPCVTQTRGTVTETNGRTTQRQQTSYDCVYSGRPATANPPVFKRYPQ